MTTLNLVTRFGDLDIAFDPSGDDKDRLQLPMLRALQQRQHRLESLPMMFDPPEGTDWTSWAVR